MYGVAVDNFLNQERTHVIKNSVSYRIFNYYRTNTSLLMTKCTLAKLLNIQKRTLWFAYSDYISSNEKLLNKRSECSVYFEVYLVHEVFSKLCNSKWVGQQYYFWARTHLTLSWRRPLSYWNQSYVMKEKRRKTSLISINITNFTLNLLWLDLL